MEGRIVTLFKVKHGKDSNEGHDLSDQKGAWSVTVPKAKGKYYATVKKDTVPTDEGRAECGAAKSKTIKV